MGTGFSDMAVIPLAQEEIVRKTLTFVDFVYYPFQVVDLLKHWQKRGKLLLLFLISWDGM